MKTKTTKSPETPKWGGHNAGQPSRLAQGSGPVYEIRRSLNLTQQQLADKIGCALSTVTKCEASGRLPRNRAVAANLHLLAGTTGEDADEGGVFL